MWTSKMGPDGPLVRHATPGSIAGKYLGEPVAVFERKPEFRQAATDALKVKIAERKSVPAGVHTVVASGLDNVNGLVRGDAARLASTLQLVEAIPAMIAAQISPSGGGSAHVRWCYDRYRSYREWDNTFQPYNGPRRQCISPYM